MSDWLSSTFNTRIISVLYIGSPKALYDARFNSNCRNCVLNKSVYAKLDHLHLVVRETNFSPGFTPELVPIVHTNLIRLSVVTQIYLETSSKDRILWRNKLSANYCNLLCFATMTLVHRNCTQLLNRCWHHSVMRCYMYIEIMHGCL